MNKIKDKPIYLEFGKGKGSINKETKKNSKKESEKDKEPEKA